MRYGFAVKVLGGGGLPSHDSRRWQTGPSLRVSIDMLRDVLAYLHRNRIRMYRISSDFVPYGTHPDMPQFHGQIDRHRSELVELGREARRLGIRLSLHPSQFVVLNALDDEVVRKAQADLLQQSELLDAMELGPEAVVVTHVGGVYGDKPASIERFIENWRALPEPAKRRVVVENDERSYAVEDTLLIHQATGSRLIFDYQHHMLNSGSLGLRDALEACLRTWPPDQTPKIHFSSPRTEMREMERKNPATGRKEIVYQPPLISQHADYVNPLEFLLFMDTVGIPPAFDVMIEAKSKDLALLSLRDFLSRRARTDLLDVS